MGGPLRLALASSSPRRRELLAGLGWSFELAASDVDESARPGEKPAGTALRLAEAKAVAGSVSAPTAWCIGADTVVDLDGVLFGKPPGRDAAARMLRALSGKTHMVHTGVAVATAGKVLSSAVESTRVTFRDLTDGQIAAFLATGEGDDKAGAYAIQGLGALLIERIEGCYFNVVGLPVFLLGRMLEGLGWSLASQWGTALGGNEDA